LKFRKDGNISGSLKGFKNPLHNCIFLLNEATILVGTKKVIFVIDVNKKQKIKRFPLNYTAHSIYYMKGNIFLGLKNNKNSCLLFEYIINKKYDEIFLECIGKGRDYCSEISFISSLDKKTLITCNKQKCIKTWKERENKPKLLLIENNPYFNYEEGYESENETPGEKETPGNDNITNDEMDNLSGKINFDKEKINNPLDQVNQIGQFGIGINNKINPMMSQNMENNNMNIPQQNMMNNMNPQMGQINQMNPLMNNQMMNQMDFQIGQMNPMNPLMNSQIMNQINSPMGQIDQINQFNPLMNNQKINQIDSQMGQMSQMNPLMNTQMMMNTHMINDINPIMQQQMAQQIQMMQQPQNIFNKSNLEKSEHSNQDSNFLFSPPNFQPQRSISVIFRAKFLVTVQGFPEDKVSSIIEKYRNKTGDKDQKTDFIFNCQKLNTSLFLNLSLAEAKITNGANIYVCERQCLPIKNEVEKEKEDDKVEKEDDKEEKEDDNGDRD